MLSHPYADLTARLEIALNARLPSLKLPFRGALRLFNGFYEGCPELVVDLYASTLVLYAYQRDMTIAQDLLAHVQSFYLQTLPWVDCVLQKFRHAENSSLRKGVVKFGAQPAEWVEEHGVRYALNLRLNQDASFYPDTRNLRAWIIANSRDQRVLNLFAYTGSLGVAALAGGARQVVQVDLKQKYLDLACRSVSLNTFESTKMPSLMLLEAEDFFSRIAFYKRQAVLFDLVIVDAPFFSTTKKGAVDLVNQSVRLVNKLRPLVADGGRLVVVNNALFLSGRDFANSMQAICQDGYLSIEQSIPIPEDICGYPGTIVHKPPADPAPFNHPTKILVMAVRRKQ